MLQPLSRIEAGAGTRVLQWQRFELHQHVALIPVGQYRVEQLAGKTDVIPAADFLAVNVDQMRLAIGAAKDDIRGIRLFRIVDCHTGREYGRYGDGRERRKYQCQRRNDLQRCVTARTWKRGVHVLFSIRDFGAPYR